MSSSNVTSADGGPQWLGHPRALFYLFFAEMWERFCFYGMRNILVLYMVNYFAFTQEYAQGGVYAAYTALIYCVAFAGGWIADRYLGYRRSIMFGGIVMAAGMILMLFNKELTGVLGIELSSSLEQFFFYAGMATIIVGNGYFKPNISTIVGKIYPKGDPRRDSGFTIFYMGINVGAFVGGLACGYIGEQISWPLGFGLAAAGMLLGVFTFGTGGCTRSLGGHGDAKNQELSNRSFPIIIVLSLLAIPVFYFLLQNSDVVKWMLTAMGAIVLGVLLFVAIGEKKEQREMMFALIVLVFFNIIFWAFFEQAGSSLTLYAQEHTNRSVFGWPMPASWPQNFNAFFIITLAPVLAWLWIKLSAVGKNPSIPTKFALGLTQLGLAFGIITIGGRMFGDAATPLLFLVMLYLLQTTGELCISPVGLSMVTKLAPERMTGMVMGAWFLSIAGANFVAGQIAALTGSEGVEASKEGFLKVYEMGSYTILGSAALLFCLVPLLKKWMHGVE